MQAIIGKKIGMSRIFDEKGNVVPVTLIMAENCVVTQVKTNEKDKYNAVQIGINDNKKINTIIIANIVFNNIVYIIWPRKKYYLAKISDSYFHLHLHLLFLFFAN